MNTPTKALNSIFKGILQFEEPNAMQVILEKACVKFGMTFEHEGSSTIEAGGETFTLSVIGEMDYTGIVSVNQPIFKAMLTEYGPHAITQSKFHLTVEAALKELSALLKSSTCN